MNVENIGKLIDLLKDEQRETAFKMESWGSKLDQHEPVSPCNTAACLAGHINLFLNPRKPFNFGQLTYSQLVATAAVGGFDIFENEGGYRAGAYLGLSDAQRRQLFVSMSQNHEASFSNYDKWHDRRRAFDGLPEPVRLAAAIKVLEILRDTGEVRWERAICMAGYHPETFEPLTPPTR